MRMNSVLSTLVGAALLSLVACGGSQPAAEEPAAETSKDEGDTSNAEKTDEPKEEAKSEAKKEKKEAKPADDGSGPKVERTAKDMLTAPEVTFMFSFNKSEPKEKAEEKCSAESKEDPKKMANCMKKASAKFQADGMQFKQDDKGQWVWLTLRRKGSALTTLHKIPFEFGEEKNKSVTIKPTGRDTGTQPMKPPAEVTIEVPDEFEIHMKDPTHGRMVYEAKIGITSADKGGEKAP